jgi:hypothetical protein
VCKQCLHPVYLAIILFNHSFALGTDAQTVAEASDIDAYASAVSDHLEGTRLRINTDSENTLASIPAIGAEGARAILTRRTRPLGIRSHRELANLLNWTQEESDLLEPYLDFSRKAVRTVGKSILRVASGPPWAPEARVLTRASFERGWLSGAVITEKDPGEQSMVDHRAGYLDLKHPNGASILLGDFRPGFGLGLVYARQTRSSIEPTQAGVTRRTRLGTSGSDENGSLRGVALQFPTRFGKGLVAYARSKWDAAISETASLRLSGDHAGDAGKSAANQLTERTRLVRFESGNSSRTIGWLWSRSEFSHPLTLDGITGNVHNHLGIDAAIQFGQNRLFAEIAGNHVADESTSKRGRAIAMGWRRVEGPLRIDLRARTLSHGYVGIRASPSSAYGGGNEWGFSSAIRYRSKNGPTIDAFLDRHGTLLPPPRWSTPRRGTRSRLSLTNRLSPHLTLEARISSIQERSQRRESPDRFSRGFRLRTRITTSQTRLTLWAERVTGRNPDHAVGRAIGADLRLTRGRLAADLWGARSRSTGTAARIFGFRPEAWGGRSVVSLAADGWSASIRATSRWAHLKIALVTHLSPNRRFALQIEHTK